MGESEIGIGEGVRLKTVKARQPVKTLYFVTCSLLQFIVFEFIWIQYICKFCFVYHLMDFDTSR